MHADCVRAGRHRAIGDTGGSRQKAKIFGGWLPFPPLSLLFPSPSLYLLYLGWRRGAVVSGVRRMNEVNARRARLVPGWVTVFGRVYHLGM